MKTCPDEETILDFAAGRLAPAATALLEQHADVCSTCLDLIAAAATLPSPEAGSGDAAPCPPDEPQRIGGYRVLEVVGQGGMGVVYLALHEASGERVALKTVIPHTQGSLTSLRREIEALARLRHPGVVRILAHGIDEQRPWYAMEHIRGPSLHWHLAALHTHRAPGEAVPAERLRETLGVLRRLSCTLSFLHGRGVVHRDLKPENVVVRPDGTPILVDFGLALRDELPGRTPIAIAELVGGTPFYMAPEQIRGELLDPRADLYALGCILYEAVTGRPPFDGNTPREVTNKHLTERPAPPSARAAGLDPALDQLIVRLLQKRPRDRIGYAEDVAAVLAPFCSAATALDSPRALPYVYRPELTGRIDLLRELNGVLRRAKGGRGAHVFVSGESGVGKTRFVAEIARRARAVGFRSVLGACTTLGAHPVRDAERSAALSPFRPLLRELVDACEGSRERADRLVGAHGRVLAAYEPALRALPGQSTYEEGPPLAAQAARERLLSALHAAIGALAEEGPLLLVLDDLQWADDLSLDVIDKAPPDFFERRGILIVGAYRSEEVTARLERVVLARGAERWSLGCLDEQAVERMVGDMLALDEVPPSLLGRLTAAAGGNPFFVNEYLRAAVDERWIVRDLGARWRFATAGEAAPPLPSSLRELLELRLSSLSAPARLVIEAAAVLGHELEGDLLTATVALPQAEGVDAQEELVTRALLERTGDKALSFIHHKLREAAYDRLSVDRRRDLHRRAARAIEQLRPGAVQVAYHAVLGHHWAHAGAHADAVTHLELAGIHALARAAHAEAASLFQRALELAPRLRDRGEPLAGDREARCERRLGEAYYALGDLKRCGEHASRALAGLGYPVPHSRARWALTFGAELARQVRHLTWPGHDIERSPAKRARLEEAARAASRVAHRLYFAEDALGLFTASLLAVNLAERTGEDGLASLPYAQLGYLAGVTRLHGSADAYFARARRCAEAAGGLNEVVDVLVHEALLHAGFGRLAQAEGLARAALARLASTATQEEDAVWIILSHVQLCRGLYEEAIRSGASLLACAQARGHRQHEAFALYAMARGHIRLGRLDEALTRLSHARGVIEATPDDLSSRGICCGLSAQTLAGRGDLDEAERMADAAMEAIRRARPSPFSLADGHEGAAEVYLALWERAHREGAAVPPSLPARAAEAGAAMRRLAIRFPLGRPRFLLHMGRVLALRGVTRGAAWCFQWVRAAAAEMEMSYEVARAERLLGELAGVEPAGG